ncbi:hypothetical protein D187_008427 [Cystobacter fuscus DSM 2262]|uniref:DUF1990 domain-containing protein n=1 Tax=Cystobacter fuscus (strain ATCC 25194 / DSM 2262 / NBRC 100088 / M29) TaxID=1242864 RepID=S9PCX8_CYSF2|nr:DUF1990 family protein [Cystobacter fuscus]EPX62240.1 hypothetical protein D187_008427 [Cystobacter fuscus DSM 2262]
MQASEQVHEGLLFAADGAGPLLQRDYWGLIDRCASSPTEVMEWVALHFGEFAPKELCVFERTGDPDGPLKLGEEMEVRIRGAGRCHVRVIHQDRQSFTLGTLPGHPEAGRITFGAYRNERGDVIFHIRSRARSGSPIIYLGFYTGGEAMQTNTWTDFVNNVALTVGEGIIGFIHADTTVMEKEHEEEDDVQGPTYLARGDET